MGDSLLEADWEAYSLEMLEKAKAKGVKLLLPVDTVMRRRLLSRRQQPGGQVR